MGCNDSWRSVIKVSSPVMSIRESVSSQSLQTHRSYRAHVNTHYTSRHTHTYTPVLLLSDFLLQSFVKLIVLGRVEPGSQLQLYHAWGCEILGRKRLRPSLFHTAWYNCVCWFIDLLVYPLQRGTFACNFTCILHMELQILPFKVNVGGKMCAS